MISTNRNKLMGTCPVAHRQCDDLVVTVQQFVLHRAHGGRGSSG